MTAGDLQPTSALHRSMPHTRCRSPFNSIKFFVLCHGMLQLAQLLVSGYLKSSISTIERRYGFSSQKSGILASFNEVGNTILIVFVSFFGSRVHRPRFIGGGALVASLAAMTMALPHFISGTYEYTSELKDDNAGLCQLETALSNHSCTEIELKADKAQQDVFPLLLLGQLLLGIGCVPIQPFGISYIDDYASKRNSPLYLGILLAVTSIGPAFGYMMGSFMLRFYVDIDKISKDHIVLEREDPRWVGAWWLGFVVAASFLFLTSLPYLFFPRQMPKEKAGNDATELSEEKKPLPAQELTLLQFLKSFPNIALRTLCNPVYLLVVLAQVNLAALIAGLATFMAKFIERQFTQTASFSNIMIGGVNIPMAVLGIVLGGVLMRRLNIPTRGAALMCTAAILMCVLSALPLLLLGCSTQSVAGVFPTKTNGSLACSSGCSCPTEVFNPVCGSDGVEFISPCHAGCATKVLDLNTSKVLNYTDCSCTSVNQANGYALPGTCGSSCKHFLLPFMVFSTLTCFIASLSQTPSYMMILRTVKPEDKSFSVGVQYMLFRVLAFLPAPVLYGTAIDTTCIIWGQKCGRNTSCQYYNMDLFRQRFLGLQVLFGCGAFVCFLLSLLVLRHRAGHQGQQEKQRYTMVNDVKISDDHTTSK